MQAADHFSAVGSNHFVCEDYALSGDNFIVIADGCSSAPFSDWGSRLVANAIRVFLTNNPIADLTLDIFKPLIGQCESFGIPSMALCSTFLAAQKTKNGITVKMMGDGTVVGIQPDGSLHRIVVEFTSNAPYYAYYAIDENSHQQYMQEFGDGSVTITGTNQQASILSTPLLENAFKPMTWNFDNKDFKAVALFTDGIKSFSQTEKTQTSSSPKAIMDFEIVNQILGDLGNFNGKFLQRKCLHNFRQFKKRDINHYDDFSVAYLRGDLN